MKPLMSLRRLRAVAAVAVADTEGRTWFESSLRDRPEHPRLFVDAATFGAFVEQAGGTPWYQIVHAAPGQGGPAEPTIVDVWVEHDDAQGRSSEEWDFDASLEDAGFDVPSHLG